MFNCRKCGLLSGTEMGMRTHLARAHGISRKTHPEEFILSQFSGSGKKSAVSKPAKNITPVQPNKNALTISVPCTLGDNKFMVDIELSIAGTAITPA